jgi:hypothetical protein
LASKILEIGKAIARERSIASKQKPDAIQDGKRAQDAVKWMQKSLALIENITIGETTGILELKASFSSNFIHERYFQYINHGFENRELFCVT